MVFSLVGNQPVLNVKRHAKANEIRNMRETAALRTAQRHDREVYALEAWVRERNARVFANGRARLG
jgi:hypothetical protein